MAWSCQMTLYGSLCFYTAITRHIHVFQFVYLETLNMSQFTDVDNMCFDSQTVYFIETERDQKYVLRWDSPKLKVSYIHCYIVAINKGLQ